jgi:dynein heavy chain 1
MSVSQWIPNLSLRLSQLEKISQLSSFSGVEVWLGGLFFPEAYVTATRQAVAHRNSWSLETLHLRVNLEQSGDLAGFIVEGAVLLIFKRLSFRLIYFVIRPRSRRRFMDHRSHNNE